MIHDFEGYCHYMEWLASTGQITTDTPRHNSKKLVRCNRCNTGELHWDKHNGHNRLFDNNNKLHDCRSK